MSTDPSHDGGSDTVSTSEGAEDGSVGHGHSIGPTDVDAVHGRGRISADEISPRPIDPRARPVLRGAVPIVLLALALAAAVYLLMR